jgi:Tol biopolymer transport system component
MLARLLLPRVLGAWFIAVGLVYAAQSGGAWAGSAVITYLREVDLVSGGQLLDQNFEVFIVDVERGVQHNLTQHRSEDVAFSWSPDGQQLALISNRAGGRDDLFLMDAQGQTLARLNIAFAPFSPQWSPQGDLIAFFGNRAGGLSDIYVLASSGGNPLNLTQTLESSEANIAWSPDGQYIATSFLDRAELTILRADGRDSYRFAEAGNLPSWSPDGQQIAYRATRSGGATLWRAAVQGGVVRPISTQPAGFIAYFAPQWSPDARTVAYISQQAGRVTLYLVDIIAQTERALPLPLKNIGTPMWSPDGKYIALHAHPTDERGATFIYVLEVASGRWRNLNVVGRSPQWRP